VFTLFFVSPEELQKEVIALIGPEAHHAISVLRVQSGEQIRLADGLGNWAEGPVTSVVKGSLTIAVMARGVDRANTTSITVAQALLKGDNQKAALDQLVQAGVDSILPWRSSRSIGAADKSEKWRDSIYAAAKQSRQSKIPALELMVDFTELVRNVSRFDKVIALHESASHRLTSSAGWDKCSNLLIIVGPEGGLSDEELSALGAAGAELIRLGHPVIRADLAGALALGAIHALTGNW